MIRVRLVGIEHLCDCNLTLEAADIHELISEITKRIEKIDYEMLCSCTILVNTKNIIFLNGFETELKENDEVLFITQICGG